MILDIIGKIGSKHTLQDYWRLAVNCAVYNFIINRSQYRISYKISTVRLGIPHGDKRTIPTKSAILLHIHEKRYRDCASG